MMNDDAQMLRMPAVTRLTGISRSVVYRLISEGKFPPPVRMSARASAWQRAAVLAYIQQRAELSGVPLQSPGAATTPRGDNTTDAATRDHRS